MYDIFSFQKSTSPLKYQLQPFSSNSPVIQLRKNDHIFIQYHCALRKGGTFVSAYGRFNEDLLKQILI